MRQNKLTIREVELFQETGQNDALVHYTTCLQGITKEDTILVCLDQFGDWCEANGISNEQVLTSNVTEDGSRWMYREDLEEFFYYYLADKLNIEVIRKLENAPNPTYEKMGLTMEDLGAMIAGIQIIASNLDLMHKDVMRLPVVCEVTARRTVMKDTIIELTKLADKYTPENKVKTTSNF